MRARVPSDLIFAAGHVVAGCVLLSEASEVEQEVGARDLRLVDDFVAALLDHTDGAGLGLRHGLGDGDDRRRGDLDGCGRRLLTALLCRSRLGLSIGAGDERIALEPLGLAAGFLFGRFLGGEVDAGLRADGRLRGLEWRGRVTESRVDRLTLGERRRLELDAPGLGGLEALDHPGEHGLGAGVVQIVGDDEGFGLRGK